ncbi:MAG: peptide deformylase [Bacteroidetes bacterium]|nr:peptide deformylase [Bacteroidota bacterium]
MAIRPIYIYGTKMLKEKAHPVTVCDDSLHKLIYDMFETMHAAHGIGLAATQVGDRRRVIVIDISDTEVPNAEGEVENDEHPTSPDLPRTLVVINPEIIRTEGVWKMEEGCLSIPEVRAEVERPEKVHLRFLDPQFQTHELFADGLLARVLLHEIDHLDGILFVDRISRGKRAALLPKLRALRKGDVHASYKVLTTQDEV